MHIRDTDPFERVLPIFRPCAYLTLLISLIASACTPQLHASSPDGGFEGDSVWGTQLHNSAARFR